MDSSNDPFSRFEAARKKNGFDFSTHIYNICVDMAERLPDLQHIHMPQVMVGFRQARKNVMHGLQASLTPMRFENGSLETVRRGKKYTLQRVYNAEGEEYLYLLNFYLPRFLNHSLEEKLTTIVHELWHISPEFDGDLRRHEGRCYVHGTSEEEYDATSRRLAQAWLSHNPPSELYTFLGSNYQGLLEEYGGVFGRKVPAPKLIPMQERA